MLEHFGAQQDLGIVAPACGFPRSAAALRWSPGAVQSHPAYAFSCGLISEPGATSHASGGSSAPMNYPPFRLPPQRPGHVVNGEKRRNTSQSPDLIARSGEGGVTPLPSLRQLVSLLLLHPGLRPGDAAARLVALRWQQKARCGGLGLGHVKVKTSMFQ